MRGDAAKCGEGVDIRELGRRVRGSFTDEHLPWLSGVVECLRKDGLAVAEERAAYGSEGGRRASGCSRASVAYPS